MRKFRRLTAVVLSLLMILSMAGTAFAAATPRLGATHCPKCGSEDTVFHQVHEDSHQVEKREGTHRDVYNVYEDKSYLYCNSCHVRTDVGKNRHVQILIYCSNPATHGTLV